MMYQVLDVPGRSGVRIHSGNFAGDERQGLKSNVEGCILLGSGYGRLDGQEAILHSRDTLKKFEALLNGRSFELIVTSGE